MGKRADGEFSESKIANMLVMAENRIHDSTLVKLYDLPNPYPLLPKLDSTGIEVRRALSLKKQQVLDGVGSSFPGWKAECEYAFTHNPITCYIAVKGDELLGLAFYDATCKNFFGPTGVDGNQQGKGIGKVLLLACLHAMRADG